MPFQIETEDGSIIELEGDQQPSEQEIDEILGGGRPNPPDITQHILPVELPSRPDEGYVIPKELAVEGPEIVEPDRVIPPRSAIAGGPPVSLAGPAASPWEELPPGVSQTILGVGGIAGRAMGRGGKFLKAATGDIASIPASIAGYTPPLENLSAFVQEPWGGEEEVPGQWREVNAPLPIERRAAAPGIGGLAMKAGLALPAMEPQIALGLGLGSVGVPAQVAAAIPMAFTPEGEFDPFGAMIAGGLPGVEQLGERVVARMLADLPITKIALQQLESGAFKGKVIQKLGGVEISSDVFRKFMEKGGGFAAVNAYLLASESPAILALPEKDRPQAILDAVAQNIAISMLGFVRTGDMSQSLSEIGKRIAPELNSFIEQVRRQGPPKPPAGAAPVETPKPALPTAPAATEVVPAAEPAKPTAAPAPVAPAEIGVQLGAKHIGTAMGMDHYEFPTIKTEKGMNMDRVQVPAGSSLEVVKAAIEKRKAQVAKDFAGEGAAPAEPTPVEPAAPLTADMGSARRVATMSDADFMRLGASFNKTNLELGRNASAGDVAELKTLHQQAQSQLDAVLKKAEAKTATPEDINRLGVLQGKVQYFSEAIQSAPKEMGGEGRAFTEPPASPEAPKPPVTPKAPEAPAAPTELHPDVQTALNVPVPDVADAKARNRLLTERQDAVRKEYGTIDQQIKELEKTILNQRGRARGRIKSTAKKSDIAKYQDLQKQRGDLRTQIVTLDQTAKADRDAIEKAQDAAIISDPKQPLIRRLDRAYRQSGGNNPELAKALSAETYRLIREKYPDASDTELERLAPHLQRSAYFGGDFWKALDLPDLYVMRQHELEAFLKGPDTVPSGYFPADLLERINRYTPMHREYGAKAQLEKLSRNELESLKQEIAKGSKLVRERLAKEAEEKAKAEKEAEAAEERLLVEAQAVADTAKRTGTVGGRSPREVRDDLVARIKGAIDKIIAHDKTTIRQQGDEPGSYIATGEAGEGVFGEIVPSEKGKFKVSARNIKTKETAINATVESKEEAEWLIKAMASVGVGKSVIGVPGDGVFRLPNYGPTLLRLWKDAKALDVSKGKKEPYVSRGGAEAPPKDIRTAEQWNAAKEYHDLRPGDRFHDWSPALAKFASQLSPEHPDWVTTEYADRWVEARVKKQEPPPLFEPPKEKAALEKPTEKPAAPMAAVELSELRKADVKADPRYDMPGITRKVKPNSLVVQIRDLDSNPIRDIVLKSSGDPIIDAKTVEETIKKNLGSRNASLRESLAVTTGPNGRAVLKFGASPNGMTWAPAKEWLDLVERAKIERGESTPKAPEAPAPAGPLIPKERADAIRERLKKKLAEQAPGEEMALEDVEDIGTLEAKGPKLDSSIFSDAVQLGAYYIQSGLHKYEAWAAQMRADFGEAIEPHLKSVYETARVTIESPSGEAGGNLRAPGLQPGLRPPNDRIVAARSELTKPYSETGVPSELLPHLDPHQKHGASVSITSMGERGGSLIADGTGVGKTREALAIAYYFSKLPNTRVIIITRAETIKPDWKKGTFGGSYFNDAKAMGIKIRLAKDAKVGTGEIGVTTYENAAAVARQADPNTVLIWDESHSLKNRSQRGTLGDKANSKAKAVLFMSATPADKPEHIYYLSRIGIMEGKSTQQQLKDLGMTLVKRQMMVKDEATGQMVPKTVHYWAPDQNVSEQDRNQRFNSLFNRMTQNGAMIKREISMQGVHVQVLKVSLPPEAHATLKEILNFFGADSVDDLQGLRKAIVLMHLRRQQEPFKIAPTVLLAQKELAAGRQVVIFVSRVNESEVGKWVKGPGEERIREVLMSSEGTAKALRAAFHEAGVHDIAEIHGEADQASLEAMADFNSGKKRIVIATIESGGTGINLDDTVGNRPRSMIVVTAPFDAVGNVQAAGRIWRLKTLSGANVFYLFGDTSVDEWNADIIGSKMAHLGAVVEGQVRRLDISDPDAVSTDDFKGTVKGKAAAEPGAPVALPALEWKPFTTKSGKTLFVSPATDAFWKWYNANGKNQNPLGLRVGKYQDKWQVWAEKQPGTESPPSPAPPPASAPEVGPGDETALEARHGTPTGLPPGINDGGPDFAQELMAASHRLGTAVRSRVTLPPGVLGRYVPARAAVARDDKIEVGDIRNQFTVSHEMGHDIDALLFTAVWAKGHPHIHSQESLKERISFAGNKKVLFDELIKVSELMRGPIGTGSSGHQRYRRRAAELIADWFALYVHEPAKARAMAPEWTHGFEKVLVGNKEAAVTVAQLHARTVTPVSPKPGAPPVGTATTMPGGVPPRIDPVIVRDRAAAIAAENLTKGEIRKLEEMEQRARIRSEKWRNDVPRKADRNDVGAFVEGIGNLEIVGDTRDDVIRRMTPAKNKLAKEYSFQIELDRQKINAYLHGFEEGEYLKYLEDYLPHFYANASTRAGKEAVARFIKNSPNAKQRKIPTLREAVDYGLIPLSQDPAVLAEIHARINWRVATNRRFLAQLKNITTAAGDPVIVPASQNPGGWVVSNNPLIARTYAHMTPGGLVLWKGGAAIHPDAWHAVRQIVEVPTKSGAGRVYDAVNAMSRANAFAFSFFHDITLTSASLGAQARWYNPLRGLVHLFETDPVTGELKVLQTTRGIGKRMLSNEDIVADAALHGLKFSWTDSETYQHAARDFLEKQAVMLRGVPVLGKSVRIARDIQASRQRNLWRNTHDALKVAAYHDLVGKALADAPPGTDPKQAKEMVASLLNDCFGGQEWRTKFWMSPQVRLAYSRFWLAPDWTLSTLRSVPFLSDVASTTTGGVERLTGKGPIHIPKEGWKGNIGRARFWTAEIAALALATIAAQWAIYQAFGKKEKGDKPWIWENESGQNRRIDVTPLMRQMPWRNPDDPTRYYVNLGKRPEEILTWFTEPFKNLQSKMARPLVEWMKQIMGTEGEFEAAWRQEHESFFESIPERLLSAGENVLMPFTFSGTQFALSLPYRKGMSRYKAQQAFESAYEIIADPSQFHRMRKALLRGNFTDDMGKVLNDIRDAAYRNGVDAEEVEKRAISSVRGLHYSRYFKAFQSGNQKKIEREVDALDRLGATPQQMEKSLERRESLQPGM